MSIRITRLIAAFVPVRSVRQKIRTYWADDRGTNNKIILVSPDGHRRRVRHVPGLEVRFDGDDNTLTMYEPLGRTDINIRVANNVNITIYPYKKLKLSVLRGHNDRTPCNIVIGRGMTSTGKINIDLCNSSGDVIIGENCLFSWGIAIRTGDYHAVMERGTHNVINLNRSVHIGNHVWVGSDVTILKGTTIPDNCVVGANATVAKQFTETNCAIAGNPARVIKTNIDWDVAVPSDYANAHK